MSKDRKKGQRGGTQAAGICKDGGACVDKSEVDHRGRPGMGNDGQAGVRTIGVE